MTPKGVTAEAELRHCGGLFLWRYAYPFGRSSSAGSLHTFCPYRKYVAGGRTKSVARLPPKEADERSSPLRVSAITLVFPINRVDMESALTGKANLFQCLIRLPVYFLNSQNKNIGIFCIQAMSASTAACSSVGTGSCKSVIVSPHFIKALT